MHFIHVFQQDIRSSRVACKLATHLGKETGRVGSLRLVVVIVLLFTLSNVLDLWSTLVGGTVGQDLGVKRGVLGCRGDVELSVGAVDLLGLRHVGQVGRLVEKERL